MRDALEAIGLHTLRVAVRLLPRAGGLAMGRGLGRLAWHAGLRRRVSLDNVRRALGAELDGNQCKAIAVRSYEHLGMILVELFQLPQLAPEIRRDQVEFVGAEHFERALQRGRGGIVASAHYGNWEFVGAGGVAHDYPVTFVVQRMSNARVDAMLLRTREGLGIRVLERGMAMRRVRDEIEANRLVSIMCDQDARRRGVFVPFFNVPSSTHKGAAQLSLRLKTSLIPAFGRRLPDGRHRVVVCEPIVPPAGLSEEEAVRAMLARFNTLLEEVIRDEPSQYLWLHRRWKTSPPSESRAHSPPTQQAPSPSQASP